MRLLLDTHVFLWYVTADPRIRAEVREAIRDPGNAVHLSVVSLWEVIIKHQLGKMPLPALPETYIPHQRQLHRIENLNLEEAGVAGLANLPPLHRDPFDRMLVAQAIHHGLTLVTADAVVRSYPVSSMAAE